MVERNRAGGFMSLLLGWVLVLGYCLAVAIGPQLIVASYGHSVAKIVLVAAAAD
jgi:hypothetical protein